MEFLDAPLLIEDKKISILALKYLGVSSGGRGLLATRGGQVWCFLIHFLYLKDKKNFLHLKDVSAP